MVLSGFVKLNVPETATEEVINVSQGEERKEGACLFLNRHRKYLMNEFKRRVEGLKQACCFYRSDQMLEPPTLSRMLYMPRACMSACFAHTHAIRQNTVSLRSAAVRAERTERVCVWKLLLTGVNHQRVEDAPEITLWHCVWTSSLIEQTSTATHVLEIN